MPQPPEGANWLLQEQIASSGEVTRSLEPRLPDLGHDDDVERDLRFHRTLSGAYAAGHEMRIEAGRVIRIAAPGRFSKFAISIPTAHVAFIAFEREVSGGLGQYDDRHPGSARLEDRCQPSSWLSIMFPVVPVDGAGNPVPIEVNVYGGRHAQPV